MNEIVIAGSWQCSGYLHELQLCRCFVVSQNKYSNIERFVVREPGGSSKRRVHLKPIQFLKANAGSIKRNRGIKVGHDHANINGSFWKRNGFRSSDKVYGNG
jgi:hypothetical protein